jgi:hypothetical protein
MHEVAMRKSLIIVFIIFLGGCTYNIPSYTAQSENLNLVRSGRNTISVIQEKPEFSDDGSIVCRASGPVKLPNGQTFSSYITDALKDELKSVNLFDERATNKLRVRVKRVDFSSSLGATNWYIDADYLVNDNKVSVSSVYHDRSSYLGTKACNNMAQYFQKAVAEHLRQLYSKAEFRTAIGLNSEAPNSSTEQARLQKLKQLYIDGLITEKEFNQKRQQVLEGL